MKIKKYKQKGFTLIELMVTISILIVFTILSAPSITEFVEKNKIKTAANSLNDGIQIARSEAIKRNESITFNLSNDQWNVLSEDDMIAVSQSEIAQTVIQDTLPSGATTLTFNNLGMLEIGKDGLLNINRIILTSQKTNYRLWVMISNSGGSRVCDPNETTLNTSIIGCI
jgi:type IV fimbrial biogenesis protein FimT